jgi:hypothetical protein
MGMLSDRIAPNTTKFLRCGRLANATIFEFTKSKHPQKVANLQVWKKADHDEPLHD